MSRVIAKEQDAGRFKNILHTRISVGGAGGGQRAHQGGVIRRAVMVEVVGPKHGAREAFEDVVFLVGGAVRADDGDRIAAVRGYDLLHALGRQAERFLP